MSQLETRNPVKLNQWVTEALGARTAPKTPPGDFFRTLLGGKRPESAQARRWRANGERPDSTLLSRSGLTEPEGSLVIPDGAFAG